MAYTKQNFASGATLHASQLNAMDSQILANANQIAANGGRPMIYCYGDSLTEGVGGYVMQPDNANAYMAYSYPAWVGQVYDVVNMGARGESMTTIMARQGADPIVTTSEFTIPAGVDSEVVIGAAANLYTSSATGLTTKSGGTALPLVEVEAAGINPVTIKGVEGMLYRKFESSAPATNGGFSYYFRRLKAGTATVVPVGTEVETFAMNHYRNGVAIFWMGANGGFSTAQDFINKISGMVTYGGYTNYVIIISRELSGENLTAVKEAFTENNGFCHVIDLMEQLPFRGYGLAGIPYQPVDTSQWSTTDPVKKNAPVLCEYLSGQSGENLYGALHYSAWGYKAIGKLVIEKLGEMGLVSGGSGGASSTTGNDEYGHYIYKLPEPKTLTGTNYLNTKVSLYDDVSKDWTVAVKWSGTPSSPSGYPANIFCCTLDGTWKGILYRYYAAEGANLLVGAGVFNVNGENNLFDNWGRTNVCVITKSGDDYNAWMNCDDKAFNTVLHYPLSDSDAFRLPLILGARYNAEGTEIQYKTAFTIEDCRIYSEALDAQDALALYNELAGND